MDKLCPIGRSAASAEDTASTESAMLEFAAQYAFDNIVLIQATSPLITGDDLDRGFAIFSEPDTDSVLSAVKQKRFHLKQCSDGSAVPDNYDFRSRPRRQDFEGYWLENGAFYITSKAQLMAGENRLGGNIRIAEMHEDSAYEIDEPSDWPIVEGMLRRQNAARSQRAGGIPPIKMFLTDCDGCLTDAGMYYSENGDELKKFSTRDGVGFELLRKRGILTGIVTAENVKLNERRAKKLQLDICSQGITDKLTEIKRLAALYHVTLEEIAYVGDDIGDVEALAAVGFGCSVCDGQEVAKSVAVYVTKTKGGEGAVREVADLVLASL